MAERLRANGVELAYARRGEGPPVLFVHGLGGSSRSWSAQAEAAVGAGFEAIAFDLRGNGASEVPAGPYSVELWAEDALALLDELGIEVCAVVGHSVGCMVAEHVAVALGERCLALAMLGGRLDWPEGADAVFEQRAKLAREGRLREVAESVAEAGFTERARPELVAEFVDALAAADPEGYAESALATSRGSMRKPKRVSSLALAFAGAEDGVTPPEASEEIASAIPGGETALVEGGAHWCQLELPDRVSEILVGFLRRPVTG